MGGTNQIGTRKTHISTTVEDTFTTQNIGGTLALEANKDSIGIFLNTTYDVIDDKARDGTSNFDAKSKLLLVSAGLNYKLLQYGKLTITPYAGFRFTSNNNELTTGTSTLAANESWIDPLVGSRFLYQFTSAITGTIYADIAGTNTSNDFTWNLVGIFGYKPQTRMKNATFYAGYRILNQSYDNASDTNKYVWNMQIAGPLIGVNFDLA